MLGIGPRVMPSHTLHPMAQPAENQKQACPFIPESLAPDFEIGAVELGTMHHPESTRDGNGTEGTDPFQGNKS